MVSCRADTACRWAQRTRRRSRRASIRAEARARLATSAAITSGVVVMPLSGTTDHIRRGTRLARAGRKSVAVNVCGRCWLKRSMARCKPLQRERADEPQLFLFPTSKQACGKAARTMGGSIRAARRDQRTPVTNRRERRTVGPNPAIELPLLLRLRRLRCWLANVEGAASHVSVTQRAIERNSSSN